MELHFLRAARKSNQINQAEKIAQTIEKTFDRRDISIAIFFLLILFCIMLNAWNAFGRYKTQPKTYIMLFNKEECYDDKDNLLKLPVQILEGSSEKNIEDKDRKTINILLQHSLQGENLLQGESQTEHPVDAWFGRVITFSRNHSRLERVLCNLQNIYKKYQHLFDIDEETIKDPKLLETKIKKIYEENPILKYVNHDLSIISNYYKSLHSKIFLSIMNTIFVLSLLNFRYVRNSYKQTICTILICIASIAIYFLMLRSFELKEVNLQVSDSITKYFYADTKRDNAQSVNEALITKIKDEKFSVTIEQIKLFGDKDKAKSENLYNFLNKILSHRKMQVFGFVVLLSLASHSVISYKYGLADKISEEDVQKNLESSAFNSRSDGFMKI